jgi:hypothetical protein
MERKKSDLGRPVETSRSCAVGTRILLGSARLLGYRVRQRAGHDGGYREGSPKEANDGVYTRRTGHDGAKTLRWIRFRLLSGIARDGPQRPAIYISIGAPLAPDLGFRFR